MRQNRSFYIGLVLTSVLAALLLWQRLPDFPRHAHERVIEPYGDGFKAIAAYLYHIAHDSTLTWYQGMNYPYGEHVIPADTQPLLSNAVKLIDHWRPGFSRYALGIFNWSMPLGMWICALFLYLILARLGLPWPYSVPIAVALTFMAPQFQRMNAHFGLAHPEVLPVLLYLLLRFDEKPSWGVSAWIALSVAIFAQLHFYYVAIMGMTAGAYFLCRTVQRREWQRIPLWLGNLGVQVLLPAAVFFTWMSGGPTDRTVQPVGFFNYKAIWESVFTSLEQPWWRWIHTHVIKIEQPDYEGFAYVGLSVGIAVLIMLYRLGKWRFRRPVFEVPGPYEAWLKAIFWAAVLILIFSFGHPFNIPGLEGLLAWAGPLRQFRSIGRFAWVFFYVGNIVAIMWLYSATKGRKFQPMMMTAAILLLAYEARNINRVPDLRLDEIEEMQLGHAFTDLPGMDYSRYQAILTVPYFNIGSDNLGAFGNDGFTLQKSLLLGVQTGLPTTSAMLTRTSLGQTLKQFQLVSEPYRPPVLFDELADKRPFLVVVNAAKLEEDAQVKRLYGHLIEGARLLYEKDILRIYESPMELFQQRLDEHHARLLAEAQHDSLHRRGSFSFDNPNYTFDYISFDSLPSKRVYQGAGAWWGQGKKRHALYDKTIPKQWPGASYQLSAWVYAGDDLAARTRLDFEEYNPTTGEVLQRQTTWMFFIYTLVDPSGWILIEFPFRPQAADTRIRFTFSNKELGRAPFYVDELLVKDESAKMYRLDKSFLWYNNRWFPL